MKSDFEKQVESAKQMLQKLMEPELTLEQSLKAYEDGKKALDEAQKMLEEAQKKLQMSEHK